MKQTKKFKNSNLEKKYIKFTFEPCERVDFAPKNYVKDLNLSFA